jgi:hypothetical protein
MDLTALIAALRQEYVPQLVQAYEEQRRLGRQVFNEVTMKIPSGLLYTMDIFVRDGTEENFLEVLGTDRVYKDSTDFTYGPMSIHFDATAWDAMHFLPSPKLTDHAAIDAWTVRWMDIDGLHRTGKQAPFDGVIHNIGWREDGSFDVDFGSSPPDAIFALFQILTEAGTQTLVVDTARLPPG